MFHNRIWYIAVLWKTNNTEYKFYRSKSKAKIYLSKNKTEFLKVGICVNAFDPTRKNVNGGIKTVDSCEFINGYHKKHPKFRRLLCRKTKI
jgi:hypothetical protein